MNSIDVILIIVLDLNNPAVNNLAPGPRVLALFSKPHRRVIRVHRLLTWLM
jgi:hypothetical protein